MDPLMNSIQAVKSSFTLPLASTFTAAEIELLADSLVRECSVTKRWTEAESALAKLVKLGLVPSSEKVRELQTAISKNAAFTTSDDAGESSPPELDGKRMLTRIRELIRCDEVERARGMIESIIGDRNRIDPLAVRAEMAAILAGIYLRQGRIGAGLDLFAQHLPGDLVALSRDTGPAAAAMQAELLCAAGERQSASDIAARLKLLWPHDSIVSHLIGKVLARPEPETPSLCL